MKIYSVCLISMLATFALAPLGVHAQTVANGLDAGGKIFIQEYWKNGAPNYCIANFNDTDIALNLKIVTAPEVNTGNDAETIVLTQWAIGAGSVKHFYIGDINQGISDKEFMGVYRGNDRVGVLLGPWSHEPEPTDTAHGITSYYNLNGSGGYNPLIWISQDKINYTSGQPVEIVLYMRDRAGSISFPKLAGRATPVTEMYIKSATSDTLSITDTADEIIIDARSTALHIPVHRATLVFAGPKVSEQTIVCLNGWWQPNSKPSGMDRAVIRGIHMKP